MYVSLRKHSKNQTIKTIRLWSLVPGNHGHYEGRKNPPKLYHRKKNNNRKIYRKYHHARTKALRGWYTKLCESPGEVTKSKAEFSGHILQFSRCPFLDPWGCLPPLCRQAYWCNLLYWTQNISVIKGEDYQHCTLSPNVFFQTKLAHGENFSLMIIVYF